METGTIIALAILVSVMVIVAAVIAQLVRRRAVGRAWSHVAKSRAPALTDSALAPRKHRAVAGQVELDEARRRDFAGRWTAIESSFDTSPRAAIRQADALLQEVMAARGYPVADFEQRAADLSVDHADLVADYRFTHRVAQKVETATPEQMRMARLHCRALFKELLKQDQPALV